MSDPLGLAIDRAAGARPIEGNTLEHHPDSAVALATMLTDMAAARQWIHLENYIIRDDHTGQRFADVLMERAAAKVRVRVLYDALGSIGTSRRFWRRLRQAGVEVRGFHPLLSLRPLEVLKRDHRKLLVTDGHTAMIGGLCIGDEWAGDPARGRQPWRDTMVRVCGPAVTSLDAAFGRLWQRAGDPLPADELDADPEECGTSSVRVVAGAPSRAHIYRSVQLLAASAAERLWVTDAYLLAPPPLYAALLDAAKAGVDVRVLVPGASDLPVLRNFTRVGYRDLLRAGVRVYEWQGPMLHAKTLLVDRRWGRVGSSNLNVSSLLTNYEMDLIAECQELTEALAAQFRRDLPRVQPRDRPRAAASETPATARPRARGATGTGTRGGPQAFRVRDGRGGGRRAAPGRRGFAPGDGVDRGLGVRRHRRAAVVLPPCDEHHHRRRCVLARVVFRVVRDAAPALAANGR